MSRATTCCSAVALVLLTMLPLKAQDPARPAEASAAPDLRLFPARAAWNITLGRVTVATPAFAGDRGFFPVDQGELLGYDLKAGTELWAAGGAPVSVPAVGDGLVFMVEPSAITALHQDSGQVAWRLPFDEPLAVPLVWDNGWLIGATVPGTILAFRATDGELIWRHDLGVRLHASPALAADRVYIPVEDHRVIALRVDTGQLVWERALGDKPNEMLALDDRIYVGSDDNFLYCLDAEDGEIEWRWRTGADVVGVPVADDRRVYFVSLDNVLRSLDRKSGAQRWKRALPNRPTRGPIRVGDVLLVSGLSTKVTAYAMRDGNPAGDFTAPGELAAAPYATTVDGKAQVVVVSRDITHGTRVVAMRRNPDAPAGNRPGTAAPAAPGTTAPGPATPAPGTPVPTPAGAASGTAEPPAAPTGGAPPAQGTPR